MRRQERDPPSQSCEPSLMLCCSTRGMMPTLSSRLTQRSHTTKWSRPIPRTFSTFLLCHQDEEASSLLIHSYMKLKSHPPTVHLLHSKVAPYLPKSSMGTSLSWAPPPPLPSHLVQPACTCCSQSSSSRTRMLKSPQSQVQHLQYQQSLLKMGGEGGGQVMETFSWVCAHKRVCLPFRSPHHPSQSELRI